MTIEKSTSQNIADATKNFIAGARLIDQNQEAYEIENITEGKYGMVNLCKVHGSQRIRRSTKTLTELIDQGLMKFLRKPVRLEEQMYFTAALNDSERSQYQHRVEVVKALNALSRKTPRNITEDELVRATAEYNKRAIREGLPPQEVPSYTTAKRWQKIHEKYGTYSSLAWMDHRRKRRGFRKHQEFDEHLEDIMQGVIEEFYADELRLSGRACYDEFLAQVKEKFFPHLTEERFERVKITSKSTFYRRLREYDPYHAELKRNGSRSAQRNFSSSAPTPMPKAIGEVVQIDCTQLDVFVHTEDKLGKYRPWAMVFIDVLTRCVIGWTVSMSPPSGVMAAQTLKKAITFDGYPYRTVVMRFVGDHGPEFTNSSFIHYSGLIGANVDFANPYHPNGKAIIESFFKTQNQNILHMLRGSTHGKLPQDRNGKPQNRTVYTIQTLRKRMEQFFEIYHEQPHSGLNRMSPEHKWMIESKDPFRAPRTISPNEDEITDTKVLYLKIKGDGVKTLDIGWRSKALAVLREKLGKRKAEVRIDHLNLGKAYVIDPSNPGQPIECEAIYPEYQDELSMEDHLLLRSHAKEALRAMGGDKRRALRRAQFVRAVREDAKKGEFSDVYTMPNKSMKSKKKEKKRRILESQSAKKNMHKKNENANSNPGKLEDYL